MSERPYTIGFANLCEKIPFASTVRQSIEAAAARHPNLSLVVRDNNMDSDTALANVQEFAATPVDLAIIYHIDEHMGNIFNSTLVKGRIPILAIDIPISWTVFFGVNNRKAGFLAGVALGKWAKRNWDGQIDKILAITEHRVSAAVSARVESGIEGLLSEVSCEKDAIFYVDGGNERAEARRVALPVLERWDGVHRIAVLGFNDDTALGALDAARELGRENDVAVAGQGADLAVEEFKRPGTRLVASTAYYPERYGEQVIALALRMLNGERVPRENLIDPGCITVEEATGVNAQGAA